jgi:hypothetical protein
VTARRIDPAWGDGVWTASLRSPVYMAALSALRHPGPSRDYYQRKRPEGRKHRQAIVALARRRLDVLWALLRDNRHFQPQPPSAAA